LLAPRSPKLIIAFRPVTFLPRASFHRIWGLQGERGAGGLPGGRRIYGNRAGSTGRTPGRGAVIPFDVTWFGKPASPGQAALDLGRRSPGVLGGRKSGQVGSVPISRGAPRGLGAISSGGPTGARADGGQRGPLTPSRLPKLPRPLLSPPRLNRPAGRIGSCLETLSSPSPHVFPAQARSDQGQRRFVCRSRAPMGELFPRVVIPHTSVFDLFMLLFRRGAGTLTRKN